MTGDGSDAGADRAMKVELGRNGGGDHRAASQQDCL